MRESAKSEKTVGKLLSNGGIIAISRGLYGDDLLRSVEAIVNGGVKAVEIAFEQEREHAAAGSIEMLKNRFEDEIAIGAGTVIDEARLKAAFNAGAEYIVSPNTDERIIVKTKELGLVSIPGAMTPTELIRAYDCGADIIKLFPAGALGPEYFKAVATPVKHIGIAAVGGITLSNLAAFKAAGACAFGISSSLFDPKLINAGRFDELAANALAYTELAKG